MSRLAEKIRVELAPKRDSAVPHSGIYIYGPPGIGKSRWAAEHYPDAYMKNPSSKWWCNYSSEEAVVIDEFVGGIKLQQMLLWADRYPCKIEGKGCMMELNTTTTVVLSNMAPWDIYPNVQEVRKRAFYRRFKVYEMKMVAGERVRIRRACPGEEIPEGGGAVPRRPPPALVRQNAFSERVLGFAAGFRRYSGHGQGEDEVDGFNDD